MATFTSTTAQSMDNLWPSAGGANIQNVLTSDASTYWIQLTNGTYVRYTSNANDLTYSGNTPSFGNYNIIEITDSSGAVLATLNNFGSQSAVNIVNTPFDTVMSGNDTIGDVTSDGIYRGGDGQDTLSVQSVLFNYPTLNGSVSGATIDGGTGSDTLEVRSDINSSSSGIRLGGSTLTSIENLVFSSEANSTRTGVSFNSSQIGVGLLSNALQITGPATGDGYLEIAANTGGVLDYSQFSFQNWSTASTIYLHVGSNVSAVSWIGTSRADTIDLRVIDSANGGDGNDIFNLYQSGVATAAQSYAGGNDSDTLQLGSSTTYDFRLAAVSSFERVEIGQNSIARFAGQQIGSGLSSSAVIAGDYTNGGTLAIDMGAANGLNLQGFAFENFSTGMIIITGDADAETIYGSSANDTINGGLGADIMDGGGNFIGGDTLSYENAVGLELDVGAVIIELGEGGAAASIYWEFADSLGDIATNFENITGSQYRDYLYGNSGNNVLRGGAGDDTLTGYGGNDTLDGGDGDDTANYFTSSQSVVVTLNGGMTSTVSVGGVAEDTLINIERVTGGAGNDILTGDANVNTLRGEDGDDILDGGAGRDTLDGGNGNDTYFTDNVFEGILEQSYYIASDNDLVNFTGTTGTFVLSRYVERLTLLGTGNTNGTGNGLANTIIGNSGDNIITGGLGADIMDGGNNGAGGDTLSYETSSAGVVVTLNAGAATVSGGDAAGDSAINFENLTGSSSVDTLTGNSGANTINGLDGNDIISGGGGDDRLSGGDGNDQFLIKDGAIPLSLDGGAGIDRLTVYGSSVTSGVGFGAISLSGLEEIQFTSLSGNNPLLMAFSGSQASRLGTNAFATNTVIIDSQAAGVVSTLKIFVGSSELYNIQAAGGINLSGFVFQNWGAEDKVFIDASTLGFSIAPISITGTSQADTIWGSGQLVNYLYGGGGDDFIRASGGYGTNGYPDTYDGGSNGAGGDTLSYETAVIEGVTINLLANTASGGPATYDTISGFENLIGTNYADTLTGDNGSNALSGGGGNDTLSGGLGNDTLAGGAGADTITGGGGDDIIYGGAAAIDATETGNDILSGGDGLDSVYGNGGNDTITGGLGADFLIGGTGDDTLYGGLSATDTTDLSDDFMRGGDGTDLLYGNRGNDTVLGGAGTDTIYGGDGNDILYGGALLVDATDIGDTVFGGIGNDDIRGNGGDDMLYGEAGDDSVIGGIGADSIFGGLGNDYLRGGDGNDRFIFNTALNATTNVDTIQAFVVNVDDIVLSQAIFAGIDATLDASEFQIGAADAATDRIIYNQTTGELFYDNNGNGSGGSTLFAILNPGTALTLNDFVMVA